ncbi:MAG: porin family protein [Chitinophagaceae bacterium]
MKTLRTLSIALAFTSLSAISYAQEKPATTYSDGPEARIGIIGGLNIATIIKTNDPDFSSTPLYGFNAGGVLQLPLGNVIALQPEVLYSQKGYRAKGSDGLTGYDYRRKLNCLDIPLLLKINLGKELGIVAGPQYSYLLSTKTTFNSGSASYMETVKNDNDNIRKNTFGGVLGLDINLDHNFFLRGRYTIDFKNNNGDGTSSTPAYKNQVFQIGLGILL